MSDLTIHQDEKDGLEAGVIIDQLVGLMENTRFQHENIEEAYKGLNLTIKNKSSWIHNIRLYISK